MVKFIFGKCEKCTAKNAAEVIAEVIKNKPNATLGLATGSSPIGTYGELINKYKAGEISFADIKTVNLDEYVGLSADHDQSYAYFMRKHLFDKVDIKLGNTNLPNGLAKNPVAECARYDELYDSFGGADLQILGIGLNGHIGFNEPSDRFPQNTETVELTESTIKANARFFASEAEVPTRAISMGIGQILRAKKIILLAFGDAKAEILYKSLFGDVTPRVPASILQFANDVEVYADEEALKYVIANGKEVIK